MRIPLVLPRRITINRKWFALLCVCLAPALLHAQSPPEIREILDRLERLEQQNRALADEVHQLRQELAATRAQTGQAEEAAKAVPALEEKTEVQENRTEELAQSKVGASQQFPIRITGMALFNAFLNSKGSGGEQYPLFAWPGSEPSGGGSLRQTTIGLDFSGPQTFLGGKVLGSVYMDFWGGSGESLDQDVRMRTADIEIDWSTRSIMAGLESPIFAPREPTSLAQVAFAPLSGAGNLWLWIPQVRFEQDLHFSDQTGLRAQFGFVETSEAQNYQETPVSVEPYRPGVEGRLEFDLGPKTGRRFEIAPGFHVSTSHVAGVSIPSSLVSLDWFTNPWSKLEFTGAFFTGENVAHLGGVQQGFTVIGPGDVIPVHSMGGWSQLTFLATRRLSFHFFSGIEDDRNSDLAAGAIGRNWLFGTNLFYRLAPNVILAAETSQARTDYIGMGNRLNNHYDLALAYLF
jgi:hypothetical protein